MTKVGKMIQKYRTPIALTALLLLVALTLAASYNLFPVTLWTQQIIHRTPVKVTAVSVNTINKPLRMARTGSSGHSASVPINTEFSGRLSELYVIEGQSVKTGQPLFKLEATSVSPGGDEPSHLVAANQKAGVSQQRQNNYDNALEEVNRYQKLYEQGAIPRRQLENAQARLQQAQANLANGQNALPSGKSTATAVNGSATIKAPIDGIVTGLSITPGQTVQNGQQLMALGSGQEVEIVVHLEQNDLYLVHLGTPATIEVSNQTIIGQVSSIYPEVEANQISSFLAHIKLTNNPDGLLKPGMSANVRIDTGKSATVIAVPTVSVFHDEQGRYFIYAVANGKAVRQPISIGETIGDFTEITSNVPQEMMVITSNIDTIKNGDAVAVVQ